MNTKNEKKYRIRHKNIHLMNVLEEDYYIDIGVIDFKVLNQILKKEQISLYDIINMDILSEGIGKITGDPISDIYYQLNYLINLRFKNSTSKFLLTCGCIKYIDDLKCEKYAPIVLIPFNFDYRHRQIVASNGAIINTQIIEFLAKQKAKVVALNEVELLLETGEITENNKQKELDKKIEQYTNQYVNTYKKHPINSSNDIDKLCLDLAKSFNTTIDPNNYFTVAFVKYNDFTTVDGYMSIESSINEMSEQDIVQKYFKTIKGIMPTNIDQKYALLKAADGDKFVVEGKLGSGKSYTIINMIADSIAKKKHVLYVNQDLDNIFDLNKNLNYLGLGNYVYNLTQNLRDIDKPDLSFESSEKTNISSDILNEVFEIPSLLQKRIHGFKINSLVEKLAILKQQYPDIIKINLEAVLEYHEVSLIYSELEKIEECLTKIDPYATNIWHRLQTSHNNISSTDIINRTKMLYGVHIELYNLVNKFINKYGLKIPSSTEDLYKLITYIYSFASFRPLPEWKNKKVRERMLIDLKEIQDLVDKDYIINKYYESNVNSNYQRGRMKEILNLLANDNIRISSDYKEVEEEYINKLIAPNNLLLSLIKDIDKDIDKINVIANNVLRIFRLSNLDQEAYHFFKGLNTFLTNHKIKFDFLKAYNNYTAVFIKKGEEISTAYKLYLQHEKYLLPKLNHFENFTMDVIKACLGKKNQEKAFAKYINYKVLKKERINSIEVIEHIQGYYENKKIVEDNLFAIFANSEFDNEYVRTFVDFFDYLSSLNAHEKVYFNAIVHRLVNEKNPNTYLKEITKVLKELVEEDIVNKKIVKKLEDYKIYIGIENIFEQVAKLSSVNNYLKKVIALKEEITSIFKNSENVKANNLLDLIQNDFAYTLLNDTIKQNESVYQKNLKKYYRGLDTAINEISKTISHYEEFSLYLIDVTKIDNLFVNSCFDELLEDVKELNSVHIKWNNHFRNFASCFRGSQPDIPTNGFEHNKKLFLQFLDKVNQIEPILTINELTEGFLKYGLKGLFAGIRSCKYGKDISKCFIYSVLCSNYEEAKHLYPRLTNLLELLPKIDDYIVFEKEYCKKNIEDLINNSPDIRKINSLINLKDFNAYNKIISSIYKNVNVFLCDLDIFNDNINLDLFDLVIIDDVHLSQASDYNRLYETKQVVVFGDKSFQTSVSNTLMIRLGSACSMHYRRRYVYGNTCFNNLWDYNNQYIYSYKEHCEIKQIETFEDFINDICMNFKNNTDHIINVVIAKESTRRVIYTTILKRLAESFSVEEVINILSYNIRILNALTEGNRYVNDVFIYFDDFKDLDDSVKELAFRNFIYVYDKVYLYYMKYRIEIDNLNIKKMVDKIISKAQMNYSTDDGIVYYVKNALKKNKQLKIENGFGCFDLIIKGDKVNAIMILGKDNFGLTTFLDDYLYYAKEYENRGWNIIKVFSLDLFNNFDQTIEKIIKEVK